MRVYLLILLASTAHAVALPFLRPRAAPAVVRAGVRTPLLVCSADSVLTASGPESSGPGFQWTPLFVVKVGALFLASAVAEIGGGWLVWQAVRAGKPWWWALLPVSVLLLVGGVLFTRRGAVGAAVELPPAARARRAGCRGRGRRAWWRRRQRAAAWSCEVAAARF